MTDAEDRRLSGDLVRRMREDAKLTQEQLAFEMGIDRSTIIRWETGQSMPNKAKWKMLCNVCKKDPVRATLAYMLPEIYDIDASDDLAGIKERLTYYLYNIAPDIIVHELSFVFLSDHGSSPEAVVQEWVANLHTPLYMRHGVAWMIANNYRQAQRMGADPCRDEIQPDTAMLDIAIDAGYDAVMEGRQHYTIGGQ